MRRRWRLYDVVRLRELPRMAGTYVVLAEGKVAYVGQSIDVGERLVVGHKITLTVGGAWETPWGRLRDVVVKVRYDRRFGERLMREARLIRRLKPPGNVQHAGPDRLISAPFDRPSSGYSGPKRIRQDRPRRRTRRPPLLPHEIPRRDEL